MLEPPVPPDEAERLVVLRALRILDTPPEARFDRITRIARQLFDVPIVLVSLVDERRQWFKSRQGLSAAETPRNISFCAHAILGEDIFQVPDASADPRFFDNPLVLGDPYIRFYAGYPLRGPRGAKIGTLCIIDRIPRALDDAQLQALADLGNWVEQEIGIVDVAGLTNDLQQATALKQAILDSANFTIISTDTEGVIRTFNRGAERMLGYGADEVVGKVTPAIIHDADEVAARAKALSEELGRTVEPGFEVFVAKARLGVPDENEWSYIRKDGSRFPVRLSVTSLRDANGAIDGFLGIGYDITERRKIDRMKTEFISTVSHELRTPLTSIRGSLGLIAGGTAGPLPEQAQALIDIAVNNSERLVRLINDILDIEKIESGKMSLDFQPHELLPIVQQAIEANVAYGDQFGVRFALRDSAPDAAAMVDADRILQVLTNLLSNAAKFSPRGERVEIDVQMREGRVRIAVTDHGPGIPVEFQPRVFEKFAQADSSDARKKGGTGLGLSISRAIVERHGGRIGFEMVPGGGSTFFFELPASVGTETSAGAGDTARVLVCEDDADVARLLALLLQQEGYAVNIAHDAEQAKRLLQEREFAAMTLDLMLPGQDGISLFRDLRAAPRTRDLPIVVVSAISRQGREQLDGGAIGIVDWIEKPIDQDRLFRALRRATAPVDGGRPRVLHVEDDPDVTRVVATIVGPHAEVVSARSVAQAQAALDSGGFDLVILDVMLPDGSGEWLLSRINRCAPPLPVIVFSAQDVGAELARKVAATLVKSTTSNRELLAKIRAVLKTADGIDGAASARGGAD